MYTIAISDYQYDSIQTQRDVVRGHEDMQLVDFQCKTEEDVLRLAGEADVIINQYAPMTRRVIKGLKNCKAIIRYGIGVDTIDIDAASERGIYVCNVPDYGVDETSNHTIALMLAMARKLSVIDAYVRRGGWDLACGKPIHRFEGSTLGLIGLGRIATAIVRKLTPFGLHILAYDPYVDEAHAKALGVQLVDLDTLTRQSDYISIHCPATSENKHMFDAARFAMMKPTAYLINAARGSIVDTAALIEALQKGQIAGAALDVLEREPIAPDSPLLAMDNVIITSHFGGYSEEAILSLQRKATEEAVNILSGNAPFNAVNRKAVDVKKQA